MQNFFAARQYRKLNRIGPWAQCCLQNRAEKHLKKAFGGLGTALCLGNPGRQARDRDRRSANSCHFVGCDRQVRRI